MGSRLKTMYFGKGQRTISDKYRKEFERIFGKRDTLHYNKNSGKKIYKGFDKSDKK